MKKLIYFAAAFVFAAAVSTTSTSCHIPPPTNDGDTVAASEFEPEDISAAHRRLQTKTVAQATVKDSVGMYYVGDGSTKSQLQLVSYPSRRDTLVYGKTRHVRVKGSADFGCVVRVKFYVLHGTDSLVSAVEQVKL